MTSTITVTVGTRVRYEDATNPPREGVVMGIEDTPWGRQYGVRFEQGGAITTTDLRQRGWTCLSCPPA